ncbi:MAG: 30S ribosomal protein S17e [Nitrososphaerales archaeon]
MEHVRRISMQILENHRNLFTDDFDKNKAVLNQVAVIRSKQLRNKIAGYITNFVKEEGKPLSEESSLKEAE